MKLTSLLSQLNELETALQSFSLEELSISEATRLKSSFEVFKNRFEDNFWGLNPDDHSGKFPEPEREDSRPVPILSPEHHSPLKGIVGNSKDVKITREPISAEAVRGLKILVFEDDKFNQWVLEKRLNTWGCIHYITDNANFGLKILQDQKIDLVLMDLHLPGTDGFEITDMIRQSPKEQVYNVPIIAISGDFRMADDLCRQQNGIDDFIHKPYVTEELLTKMISATKLHKDGTYNETSSQNTKNPEQKNKLYLDLQPLLTEFQGQVDLVEEFAELYRKNILEYIGQVKLGLQQEDVNTIEFAAHKIKTSLRIIPTPGLLGIVESMHTMSKNSPDFEMMRILHEAFIAHFPKVEHELNETLKMLKN